ncbi:MAG: hypothetical protein A3K03_07265 [Bdellovibrionales bacterium RIFOXYD1_FULL_44_7]|nr:MAG: hypothetical protein A3K03_07265 [Bdellovibrionales bacterium RIFOXYD1_FULL_44_7]
MPRRINSKCTKCGACVSECPTGSITEGKDLFIIDTDTCGDHGLCASVCPAEAIEAVPASHNPKDQEEEE